MSTTSIEWTDRTWNPLVGCSIVSPGCTNCYAMKMAARLSSMSSPALAHYRGTTQASKAGPVWTGNVHAAPDSIFHAPLEWKKPVRIFVNSMSDLFHEYVPDELIDRMFAVMALTPRHTYQVLTKRPERMHAYLSAARAHPVGLEAMALTLRSMVENPQSDVGRGVKLQGDIVHLADWPLPNVWLGVSVEDQVRANERIPLLLQTPAAKRFVSAEPLLGPIDLSEAWHGECALASECWGECLWCAKGYPPLHNCQHGQQTKAELDKGRSGLDWVIVGGESGREARPMHPDWARILRDQCAEARVPFFFKQWGEWTPGENVERQRGWVETADWFNDEWSFSQENMARDDGHIDDEPDLYRVGKKEAGAHLDGVLHREFPA